MFQLDIAYLDIPDFITKATLKAVRFRTLEDDGGDSSLQLAGSLLDPWGDEKPPREKLGHDSGEGLIPIIYIYI